MLTLVKLDTAVAFKAEKLGVGDVIATHNGTQHLRRIDALEVDGDSVHVFVSKPKAGGDEAILTFPKGTQVNVMGRVEEPKARPATTPKAKAAPKGKATAKRPAPVKRTVTKVDAVAQTTPTPIHGKVRTATGVKMTPKAAEAPKSSIREAIRTELRSAVEALILTEVKALITEALA